MPYTGDVPKPIEWGNVIEEFEACEMMGIDDQREVAEA
jgi:hypothetical protein